MPRPTHSVAVRHPETGAFVALDPVRDYDPGDPIVGAYGWAFAPFVDENGDPNGHKVIESVVIEHATARPGEKRATRRAK